MNCQGVGWGGGPARDTVKAVTATTLTEKVSRDFYNFKNWLAKGKGSVRGIFKSVITNALTETNQSTNRDSLKRLYHYKNWIAREKALSGTLAKQSQPPRLQGQYMYYAIYPIKNQARGFFQGQCHSSHSLHTYRDNLMRFFYFKNGMARENKLSHPPHIQVHSHVILFQIRILNWRGQSNSASHSNYRYLTAVLVAGTVTI